MRLKDVFFSGGEFYAVVAFYTALSFSKNTSVFYSEGSTFGDLIYEVEFFVVIILF